MFSPKFTITSLINKYLTQISLEEAEKLLEGRQVQGVDSDDKQELQTIDLFLILFLNSIEVPPQKKALDLSTEGPFTLQDLEKVCPEVSRRTLQRDLAELLKLNLLKELGATSKKTYLLNREDLNRLF